MQCILLTVRTLQNFSLFVEWNAILLHAYHLQDPHGILPVYHLIFVISLKLLSSLLTTDLFPPWIHQISSHLNLLLFTLLAWSFTRIFKSWTPSHLSFLSIPKKVVPCPSVHLSFCLYTSFNVCIYCYHENYVLLFYMSISYLLLLGNRLYKSRDFIFLLEGSVS